MKPNPSIDELQKKYIKTIRQFKRPEDHLIVSIFYQFVSDLEKLKSAPTTKRRKR